MDDVDMPGIEDWLGRYAEAVGQPMPDRAAVAQILELAGVAAHASTRQAAPVACWMAGVAGLPLVEVLRRAEGLDHAEHD